MRPNRTILIYNSVPYFVPLFFEKGLPAYQAYRQIPFLLKILRKISLKTGCLKTLWFDDWKKDIKAVDTVIVFSTNPLNILYELKKLNPRLRVIFWYWNPILKKGIKPNQVPDLLCEKWSFDEVDCKKYGLKHNTTFYFDNIKLPEADIKYDVVFIGVDKGRKFHLNSIKEDLIQRGFNPFFHIVDDNWSKRNYKGENKPMGYARYLQLLSESRVILDYIQEGQHGLTLRPLESIFLKKKLITNDPSIVKHDFYNSNNIFILGVDNIDDIESFISTPFVPLSDKLLKKYDVEEWVKRFFN